MEDFQTYAPEEIVLANLEEILSRSLRIREQERAHLRELAVEIAAGFSDSGSFPEALTEHRLPLPTTPVGEEKTALPKELLLSESTRQRILLCTELRALLPAPQGLLQEFFFPASEEPDPASFHRISYQRNNYTDLAYDRFSGFLHAPRASYANGFASVCEEVYNGLSEYCILPIENSSEGRLNSFSKLIEQYSLKIAATCEINTGEDRITKFALLRKSLGVLRSLDSLPQYFEFSCELSEYPRAEDLLVAARYAGLTPIRTELRPRNENGGVQTLHAVLDIEDGDLPAFLLYLFMELPNANPIGLYHNIPLRLS